MSLQAEIDLARLDRTVQRQVSEKLRWLEENFENIIPIPLGGKWSGFFKLRSGDWRIIYNATNGEQLITIYLIDHRSRIYKR